MISQAWRSVATGPTPAIAFGETLGSLRLLACGGSSMIRVTREWRFVHHLFDRVAGFKEELIPEFGACARTIARLERLNRRLPEGSTPN